MANRRFNRVMAAILAAGSLGGGPSPAASFDFTTSLPAGITFARANASNAIVTGVVTPITSGTPAFESWKGVNRGMRLGAAGTNLFTFNEDLTNAAWPVTGVTAAAGTLTSPTGSGLMTACTEVLSGTSQRGWQRNVTATAGLRQSYSVIVKKPANGDQGYIGGFVWLREQFAADGTQVIYRYDGTFLYSVTVDSASKATNCQVRVRDLGNGFYQIEISVTWVNTGTKSFGIFNNFTAAGFTPSVAHNLEAWGVQLTNTPGPIGYISNPSSSTNASAAETATIVSPAWLDVTKGTFIIEHDCQFGTLLGSGTTAHVSATFAGKTAYAYDATGTDTVTNGGASTNTGVAPTIATTLTLLGTTALQNSGRIKSLTYYASRLSVAQIQALTSPVSTAAPGSWRTVSSRNRLPTSLVAMTGTQLNFVVRCAIPIAGGDVSQLSWSFANWAFPGSAFNTNSFVIDGMYLERVTSVAECVPIKLGGSTSWTVDNVSNDQRLDVLLPSALTGLTKFNNGDSYYLQIRGHVTTIGHFIPGARWTGGTDDVQGYTFNPVNSLPTSFGTPGALVMSGSNNTSGYQVMLKCPCPITLGKFVSGDPKSIFITGDSIVEGVSTWQGYSWIEQGCADYGIPTITLCQGGSTQTLIAPTTNLWYPYLAFARVLVDEMGTNSTSNISDFAVYWQAAKNTYGYDKVYHYGLLPRSTSTDSWTTLANQTVFAGRTYPVAAEALPAYAVISQQIDGQYVPTSIRDSGNFNLIKTDGVTPFAFTIDGEHPNGAANTLLRNEIGPILNAITVT